MPERNARILVVGLLGVALGVGLFMAFGGRATDADANPPESGTTTTALPPSSPPETSPPEQTSTTTPSTTTPSTTTPDRAKDHVPGWTVGQPWGEVEGVTMFRGNPTRTFYGTGPIGAAPVVRWRYPESGMCSSSSVGGESTVWCGMGWTGQPVIYDRDDGKTELIFGAYDRAVHFVDAATGTALRSRFVTGDIIKGSVTLDPNGYPLIYFGSRDNKLRIVALDRDQPTELWSLDATAVNGIWNNDWDSNPVIVDDIMYEGGENGWFFAYELNRGYDSDGMVTVSPERLLAIPGYTDQLISRVGRNVSIESSTVAYEQRVYFTNSGGRVVGLDVSDIRNGNAPIVFDYWAGGDIDATPVVDEDGFLYVSIEFEPGEMNQTERTRALEVGQLLKLDPYTSGDPRVWGIDLTAGMSADSGIWATPALHAGHLYVPTHSGSLIAVNTETGETVWSDPVAWHSWSSPVVVDDVMVHATCDGEIRAYSLENPASPTRLWAVPAGGACLEATPVVWNGTIYIGSRDGYFRALR